jgi:YD repeat-containing protein
LTDILQSNLRVQEVTAGGTRHLGYDLDGRLTTMTAAHAAFTRKLREDGYVTQYDELKSGKLTRETS